MTLKFEIPGPPKGKGRARFARAGKFVRTYTPGETVSYENLVKLCAREQMKAQNQRIMTYEITMAITAIFPIPRSWSKIKTGQAIIGGIRPSVKPDCDNIGKIIGDALNGIVYLDDRAIVSMKIDKFYGDEPKTIVEVSEG